MSSRSLSPELLAHLVDPETREPVRLASDGELETLRRALASRKARRRDGGSPPESFEGALLTPDGRRAYLVVDGIPNFLVDERIELDTPLEDGA